jgi:hypothetical protein
MNQGLGARQEIGLVVRYLLLADLQCLGDLFVTESENKEHFNALEFLIVTSVLPFRDLLPKSSH